MGTSTAPARDNRKEEGINQSNQVKKTSQEENLKNNKFNKENKLMQMYNNKGPNDSIGPEDGQSVKDLLLKYKRDMNIEEEEKAMEKNKSKSSLSDIKDQKNSHSYDNSSSLFTPVAQNEVRQQKVYHDSVNSAGISLQQNTHIQSGERKESFRRLSTKQAQKLTGISSSCNIS